MKRKIVDFREYNKEFFVRVEDGEEIKVEIPDIHDFTIGSAVEEGIVWLDMYGKVEVID